MSTIHELQQQRAARHAEARAILDAAQDAGRDLTADEEQKFDRLMDAADTAQKGVDREERSRRHQLLDAEAADEGRSRDTGDDAQTVAFRAYLLGGARSLNAEQQRALNMGNDPEGGYLVAPQQFVTSLIQAVDDMLPLRGLATTQQLTSGESLGIPTLDTDLNDADWTSEIATGAQDDALRVGKREFRPHPLAKRVKISRTLLRRAAINPETLVMQRLAHKFGVTQEKAFMTGDGNQKPLGLFTASADGISTARDVNVQATGTQLDSNTATTGGAASDLIDAKHTLKSQYWARARWLFHRTILGKIRKLRDANGQYLWQPGLSADRPDTILDVPYVMSEFAPSTITNDAYIGMIGDFSQYWIADSLAMDVQRLVELYAETNQIGIIGRLETDGAPVLEEAFVRLQIEEP